MAKANSTDVLIVLLFLGLGWFAIRSQGRYGQPTTPQDEPKRAPGCFPPQCLEITPLGPNTGELPAVEPSIPIVEPYEFVGPPRPPSTYYPTQGPGAGRGIRNNNPFNIKITSDRFQGEIPRSENTDGVFEQFYSPYDGLRAGFRILLTYRTLYGLTTVEGIIRRWSATDQAAYVRYVSEALRIAPGAPLSIDQYIDLGAAMIYFENGRQPYSRTDLRRAADRAGLL